MTVRSPGRGDRRPADDVLVAGGGPAAWATAAACGRAGLRVTLLAPEAEPTWPATYAAWADDLPLDDLGPAVLRRRWDAVGVVAGPGGARRLARPYAVLDNAALAAELADRCRRAGVTVVAGATAGRVVGAVAEHGGRAVATADGTVRRAVVVVDATGAPAALVHAPAPPAWQVAHGVLVPTPPGGVPGAVDGCLLMDWTPVPGEADPQPSFLYALDLGDGTTLLEETVLAAARPLAAPALARRLERRLGPLGLSTAGALGTESVRIPMGLVAPAPQAVVGTGAAGGLVHPATGYSVAASLRAAPRLAAALAAGLDRGAEPDALARLGWDAVWPVDRRRARALERFGFDAVAAMDAATLGAFFDAFFALPGDEWAGYLSGTLPAARVAALMTTLFRRVPWSLRRRLTAGDPRWLLRALRP